MEKIFDKDEWTQEEFYRYSKELEKDGIKTYLIDTILKPIDGIETMVYNPFEIKKLDKEKTVLVFYCDTGKSTMERLSHFRSRLEGYKCVSLRGGRGYWRPNFKPDNIK